MSRFARKFTDKVVNQSQEQTDGVEPNVMRKLHDYFRNRNQAQGSKQIISFQSFVSDFPDGNNTNKESEQTHESFSFSGLPLGIVL